MNDNIVATVWSFKNDFQKIPYKIYYTGTSKREGGAGQKFVCSCPHSAIRKAICKHVLSFKGAIKDKSILSDTRFNISDYGMSVLGLC
jgi:hypothetical protein